MQSYELIMLMAASLLSGKIKTIGNDRASLVVGPSESEIMAACEVARQIFAICDGRAHIYPNPAIPQEKSS